jgi:hypothetical protein
VICELSGPYAFSSPAFGIETLRGTSTALFR